MGFCDTYIMPRLVHFTCGLEPTMKQRQKVVPRASGDVLEIGIGSGLNIPYYDSSRVRHLWGLDPSPEMWSIARPNADRSDLDVEYLQSGAESIPLEDAAADTVVMTYTLCTIPDPERALAEIRRVLKPRGKLLFCEHGRAPDRGVRRWQDRLNSVWGKLSGGCNLNRPISDLLEDAGFHSRDLQTMYIPGWRPACFNYWGSAEYHH